LSKIHTNYKQPDTP